MPTTLIDLSKQAQDQILDAVKQGQKATVEAVEIWARSVEPFVAAVPAVPVAPGVAGLPAPKELVANWYGFAGKLLDAQSAYWQSVIAAAEPAFPKVEKPAPAKSA
jgi:hypothetical protein